MTETLLRRADLLDPADRALLEQVFAQGVPLRKIAVLSERSERTVQRRVRKLTRRLTDPQVLHVMRHRHSWDTLTADVATAVWIRGLTFEATARELNISLHRVRQCVEAVRGLLKMNGAPQ